MQMPQKRPRSELTQLLRPREAAAFLSISERTLKRLVARGDLGSVRVGKALRFEEAELRAFLTRNRQGGWA